VNDLSEKEQLDELRAWWQENRAWIIGGVAIGLAAIIGFRMYSTQQLNSALEASAHFEALAEEVADNDLAGSETLANTLFTEYDDTVYASQARLAMARLYMDSGRDADAAEVLGPLARSGGDDPLALVARLRLARVLLFQEKPQQALELLDLPSDTAFTARFNELIGDAHFALGNMEEAAAAYEAVLADINGQQTINVDVVRMKLNDLPDTSEAEPMADAGEADEVNE